MTHSTSTGIYRTDSERNGTHGWIVFAQRRRRVFTKHFADGVHGGQNKAYRAASEYRERLLKEAPRVHARRVLEHPAAE